MKRILELMDQKNHFLEKFYSVNEKSIELFVRDQFETINEFYQERENILEIIKYIDKEIKIIFQNAQPDNEKDLAQFRKSLSVKDTFVEKIIEQDIAILSCIEAAKNQIIKELKDVKLGKKVVSAYKNPQSKNKLEEVI